MSGVNVLVLVTFGTLVGTVTGSGIILMILSSYDVQNRPTSHAEHVRPLMYRFTRLQPSSAETGSRNMAKKMRE